MMVYRTPDETDDEALGRDEIVELDARAAHEIDAHPGPLASCTLGCWASAEAAFDDAFRGGELVVANAGA